MKAPNRQRGVALVAVIFLIVVIGAALTVMARLSTQSNAQINQSLVQARARQAAGAGIEWAIQRLVEDASACASSTTVSIPAYSDYTVAVTCTSGGYNRPNQRITLYRLTAQAEVGTADSPEHGWARLEASIEL